MWKKVVAGTVLSVGVWAGGAAASDLDMAQANQQQTTGVKENKKVVTYDKDTVKRVMMEDGMSEEWAEERLNALMILDARLQGVLDTYVENRTISDEVSVEGLTVKMMMFKDGSNFWDALIGLDYYLDKPDLARLKMSKFPVCRGQDK